MPNFNLFNSLTQLDLSYNSTTFISGYIAEGFTAYTKPTLSGSGNPSNDPGGLFGWLLWSRADLQDPPVGYTYDTYIIYNNRNDFLRDLNAIGNDSSYKNVPFNLNPGATYTFFYSTSGDRTVYPNYPVGYDFLQVINVLSFGARLVLAGNTTGLLDYMNDNSTPTNTLKLLIGQTADSARAKFVESNNNLFGVFPTVNNGLGYTAAPFDTLFGATSSVLNPTPTPNTAGPTAGNRIINIYGRALFDTTTTQWQASSALQTSINCTSDFAGAMARSSAGGLGGPYGGPAGIDYSSEVNTKFRNIVDSSNTTLANILKKNRVNYYTAAAGSKFLPIDLVGATAALGSTYANKDRIGPNYLAETIERAFLAILQNFISRQNNAQTRSEVVTALETAQYSLAGALAFIQNLTIICDGSNNTDNSATLRVDVSLTPVTTTVPSVDVAGTQLVFTIEGMA